MSDQSSQKPGENKPLNGIRVLVTRPSRKSDSLLRSLESRGAEAVVCPLIAFSQAPDPARLKDVFRRLSGFSIVAFLSRQAAVSFEQIEHKAETLPPIAAIGIGTRDSIQLQGQEVQFLPQESNSQSMAELLIEQYQSNGFSKPILILRADRGSEVLPKALIAAEVPFEELAVYSSKDVDSVDPSVIRDLADRRFHWLTITSSAIARNAARILAGHIGKTKIVSISPTTSLAAIESGLVVSAEATEYNMDGLVDAIVRHEESL